jgi:isopenicillin N synthase-like dioxygenase
MLRLMRHAAQSPASISSRSSRHLHVMTAAKVDRDAVPLVNVAPLLSAQGASPSEKQRILEEMKRACVDTGFFTIPTKDVLPNELIAKVRYLHELRFLHIRSAHGFRIFCVAQAYTRSDEFLALPTEVKQKYHVKKSPNARGWTPMFEEPSVRRSAARRAVEIVD